MKLAEALRLRKDCLTRLRQLESRILTNCRVQEGEEPSENPDELLQEYLKLSEDLAVLVRDINLTNTSLLFTYGSHDKPLSMTQALAERDQLKRDIDIFRGMANKASAKLEYYSRTEIKSVSTINVKLHQSTADKMSQELRILDTKVQEQNWLSDLIELK